MKMPGRLHHGSAVHAFRWLAMLVPIGAAFVLFRVIYATLDDGLVAALGVAMIALFGVVILAPAGTRHGHAPAPSHHFMSRRPRAR